MIKSIYSWNKFSEGARLLALEMGISRIKHEGSRYRGNPRKTVINWGSSTLPDLGGSRIINDPELVAIASDKLAFFYLMFNDGEAGPRIPEFTTDRAVALEWMASGKAVCARTVLRGSGAVGLHIIEANAAPDTLPEVPLYVKYVKKMDEFRVHIVGGVVIDTQKKMRRREFEGDRNTQIRNLANGYIFAREGFEVPEDVLEQSRRAMACSGLDFGACDVLWNQREQQAYVLEINTAPGLQGTTLTKYAEALSNL